MSHKENMSHKETFSNPDKRSQENQTKPKDKKQEILANLNSENQSFFNRMSEKEQRVVSRVYEGLYEVPVLNRIIGKMEIAYNQSWADQHQKEALELKSDLDKIDFRIDAFDQSKKEIESVIEDLKKENIPGVTDSLQLKIQNVERKKAKLLNKKDKIQSRIEAKENKMKTYINKRDYVVDKFINRYEGRLEPMEVELEKLQTYKNEVDLLVATTEVRYKEQLASLENKKARIISALRKTGMSERKIRNFENVKEFNKILKDRRKRAKAAKERLEKRKIKISQKIAKVDAKANSYRDKREKFIRIKNRKPIEFNVKTRRREEAKDQDQEEVLSHNWGAESASVEKEEEKEKRTVKEYIEFWNNSVTKDAGGAEKLIIEIKYFEKTARLSKNFNLSFEDFKKILGKYLKVKGMSTDYFNEQFKNKKFE